MPRRVPSALPPALGSDTIPHGIARPGQRATMSVPLEGVLIEIPIATGAQVRKGEVLAVMDNRIAQSAVKAAEAAADRTAEIDHARHALALAESLAKKHRELQDVNAGAEFEREQATVQRDQAQARLDAALENQLQARRNLELEQARLETHNIRAPFDGQIVHIEATVGTTLKPPDGLLTIVSLDTLEAELHLPLERFAKLRTGRSYRLWAFAPVNAPVHARLDFASPMIDPASKTFRCVFTIDNRDHQLPAGFGVRLDASDLDSYHEDLP